MATRTDSTNSASSACGIAHNGAAYRKTSNYDRLGYLSGHPSCGCVADSGVVCEPAATTILNQVSLRGLERRRRDSAEVGVGGLSDGNKLLANKALCCQPMYITVAEQKLPYASSDRSTGAERGIRPAAFFQGPNVPRWRCGLQSRVARFDSSGVCLQGRQETAGVVASTRSIPAVPHTQYAGTGARKPAFFFVPEPTRLSRNDTERVPCPKANPAPGGKGIGSDEWYVWKHKRYLPRYEATPQRLATGQPGMVTRP